jgi:hypothetical protein
MPHREFLKAARAEKSDITLQALCDRLLAERGVKADTSMMSRLFRKIGVTFERLFAVGPMNRRCAPDYGRRRNATIAQIAVVPSLG